MKKFIQAQRNKKLEAERQAKEWEALMKKHSAPLELGAKAKGVRVMSAAKSKIPVYVPEPRLPSLVTSIGNATKAEPKVYTGDKMIGIVVQHKSCLQPVFSQEAAIESATMRRG